MARKRDYKAEYERRIANAVKRGLSRSQARGHAKASESPVRPKPVHSDSKLEAALKLLRQAGGVFPSLISLADYRRCTAYAGDHGKPDCGARIGMGLLRHGQHGDCHARWHGR